ncbi:MAG: hypothetical protein HY532_07890 [Chloroflexi bacterium]|nr:hypothetical protein [Chloroflexota bacterium]
MHIVILVVLAAVFWSYMWTRIFEKMGYNQWLGLVMLAPIVNAIALVMLAFAEWPIESEVRSLRS